MDIDYLVIDKNSSKEYLEEKIKEYRAVLNSDKSTTLVIKKKL